MSGFHLEMALDALAERLAPILARRLLSEMPRVAQATAEASARLLSINQAARLVKVRTATLSRAVRLPPDHPGHLKAERGGISRRGATAGKAQWLIKAADVSAWRAQGGAQEAARTITNSAA